MARIVSQPTAGPVTGSANFFVQQTLDVSGTINNPTGHLILSSSATSRVAISGNLLYLKSGFAPSFFFAENDFGFGVRFVSSSGIFSQWSIASGTVYFGDNSGTHFSARQAGVIVGTGTSPTEKLNVSGNILLNTAANSKIYANSAHLILSSGLGVVSVSGVLSSSDGLWTLAPSVFGTSYFNSDNGTLRFRISPAFSSPQFQLGSAGHVVWDGNLIPGASGFDAGVTRDTAGALKVTDASTGMGSLRAASLQATSLTAVSGNLILSSSAGSTIYASGTFEAQSNIQTAASVRGLNVFANRDSGGGFSWGAGAFSAYETFRYETANSINTAYFGNGSKMGFHANAGRIYWYGDSAPTLGNQLLGIGLENTGSLYISGSGGTNKFVALNGHLILSSSVGSVVQVSGNLFVMPPHALIIPTTNGNGVVIQNSSVAIGQGAQFLFSTRPGGIFSTAITPTNVGLGTFIDNAIRITNGSDKTGSLDVGGYITNTSGSLMLSSSANSVVNVSGNLSIKDRLATNDFGIVAERLGSENQGWGAHFISKGQGSAGAVVEYGRISIVKSLAGSTNAGKIIFYTNDNNTSTEKLTITENGTLQNRLGHLILSSSAGSIVYTSGALHVQEYARVPGGSGANPGLQFGSVSVGLGGAGTTALFNVVGGQAGSWWNLRNGGHYLDIAYGGKVAFTTGSLATGTAGIGISRNPSFLEISGGLECNIGHLVLSSSGGSIIHISGALVQGYGQAGVTVNTATAIVDSFSTTTYRTMKYTISATSGGFFQSEEILLMHSGTTVSMAEYSVLSLPTTAFVGFVASITGSTLNLMASGSTNENTIKFVRTPIVI